jgi:hypothetical protein
MKGKIGLVVGLGVGYVLGTRAGRERYEQIKTQWLKVWHLDPVQKQVTRAQDFAKAQVAAAPGAIWRGVVKVISSVSDPDAGTVTPAVPASTLSKSGSAPKSTTSKSTTSKSPASKSPSTTKKKTPEAE